VYQGEIEMAVTTNKEIIEKVNAGFEQNNPEVFLDNCAEDVRWIMAGDDEIRTGKESVRQFMASMGDAKLTSVDITSIIAEGDSAACYGEMTMDENGTPTSYSYCDVYRFSGDKITELRSFVVKQKTEGESEQAASA
jgi:uncharacterized protein